MSCSEFTADVFASIFFSCILKCYRRVGGRAVGRTDGRRDTGVFLRLPLSGAHGARGPGPGVRSSRELQAGQH